MNKNWLDNPITWRKYFKVAGVSMVIGMIITLVYYMQCFGYGLSDVRAKVEELFKKKN